MSWQHQYRPVRDELSYMRSLMFDAWVAQTCIGAVVFLYLLDTSNLLLVLEYVFTNEDTVKDIRLYAWYRGIRVNNSH